MYAMMELRLEEMLTARGISLYKLAKETGAHYNSLYNLQEGRVKLLNLDLFEKICRVLNCAPGDLLVLSADSGQVEVAPKND